MFNRVNSSIIELNDLLNEVNSINENLDLDTSQWEEISNKIDLMSGLLKKQHVETVSELIEIRDCMMNKRKLLSAPSSKLGWRISNFLSRDLPITLVIRI